MMTVLKTLKRLLKGASASCEVIALTGHHCRYLEEHDSWHICSCGAMGPDEAFVIADMRGNHNDLSSDRRFANLMGIGR